MTWGPSLGLPDFIGSFIISRELGVVPKVKTPKAQAGDEPLPTLTQTPQECGSFKIGVLVLMNELERPSQS